MKEITKDTVRDDVRQWIKDGVKQFTMDADTMTSMLDYEQGQGRRLSELLAEQSEAHDRTKRLYLTVASIAMSALLGLCIVVLLTGG